MAKKSWLPVLILLAFVLRGETAVDAQEGPNIHVVVNMVQLNVAVTDKKGNYITGLRPEDFEILEDGIVEKAATFAEGDESDRSLSDVAAQEPNADANGDLTKQSTPQTFGALVNGANVYVLFDTSDYMYRGFVFAQDAITDFIRSLGSAD